MADGVGNADLAGENRRMMQDAKMAARIKVEHRRGGIVVTKRVQGDPEQSLSRGRKKVTASLKGAVERKHQLSFDWVLFAR